MKITVEMLMTLKINSRRSKESKTTATQENVNARRSKSISRWRSALVAILQNRNGSKWVMLFPQIGNHGALDSR